MNPSICASLAASKISASVRIGAAIADVVEDRVVEQNGVLRHDADERHAEKLLRHVAYILAVDSHCGRPAMS